MHYYNFDLTIRATEGHYSVHAHSEKHGEVSGPLSFDWAADTELRKALSALEQDKTDEALLRAVGERLYTGLFADLSVRSLFDASLGDVVAEEDMGLRVRLHVEVPKLAPLPWELLYNRERDRFLGAWPKTLLVRYLEILEPIRELQVSLPLRMLLVAPGGSGLEVEKEKQQLQDVLQDLTQVIQLDVLDGTVTSRAIRDQLRTKPYHVFHFVGHGVFSDEKATLLINNEDGGMRGITDRQFADFFEEYSTMRLVFLNVCHGARSAATTLLAGAAPLIVRKGVPSVVGMQYRIRDDAARLLAREFYAELCSLHRGGRVDAAVTRARIALHQEFPGGRELATPVLFLRSSDGVIFELPPEVPIEPEEAMSPQPIEATDDLLGRYRYHRPAGLESQLASLRGLAEQHRDTVRWLERQLHLALGRERVVLEQQIEAKREELHEVQRELAEVEAVLARMEAMGVPRAAYLSDFEQGTISLEFMPYILRTLPERFSSQSFVEEFQKRYPAYWQRLMAVREDNAASYLVERLQAYADRPSSPLIASGDGYRQIRL